MDFKKKLIISSSILGGLIVLFVIGTAAAAINRAPQGEILFPDFKADAIVSITVTDQNGVIELDKTQGDWNIRSAGKNYEADRTTIGNLVNNIADLRKNNIAG